MYQAHVTAELLIQRNPRDGLLDESLVSDLTGLPSTAVRMGSRPGQMHYWCHSLVTVVTSTPGSKLSELLDGIESSSAAAAALRLERLRQVGYKTVLHLRVEHLLSPDDYQMVEDFGMGLLSGVDLPAPLMSRMAALGLHLWVDPELRKASSEEMDDDTLTFLEDLANGQT